jgi:tyrosine-protein kinase Etk/Wzc
MESQVDPHVDMPDDSISLLGLISIVARRWKLVILLSLVGSFGGGVYSMYLPKVFEATASVLPPGDARTGRGFDALSQFAAASPLGGLLAGSGNKDVFMGILKSRTMQDDAIKKFELVKVYKLEGSKRPMQSARIILQDMTNISASKEGVISVTASAHDPKMAADIANFYVENLDRLNTAINVTEAGRSRLFLEGRVAEAQKALREAEDRLKTYQSQTKAVVLEGQTRAAIEGAARLEGQIQAAEVQLKTLETYSTARNPDVIKLRESIDEMRRQLRRMEYGRGQKAEERGQRSGVRGQKTGSGAVGTAVRVEEGVAEEGGGGMGGDFAVPLGSIPATGAELVRLIRELKMQETISTLLTQQLEQAKIAEAKDTPTVRILDRALPPEWKSRPSVLNNTAVAGIVSLFVGMLLAFILEGVKNAGARRRKA